MLDVLEKLMIGPGKKRAKRYYRLNDDEREYRNLAPAVRHAATETRQSIRLEMRAQAKAARRARKQRDFQAGVLAKKNYVPASPRPKWAKALLQPPFNKRSRKAKRFR